MAHDVFLSYSSKDKPAAFAICAALENRGIGCWIAPRDIAPGANYPASIIRAINTSKLLVLAFSENANQSPSVASEVERAFTKRVPIVPVRIGDVPVGDSLEFFLSTPQWIDACEGSLDEHLHAVVDAVGAALTRMRPAGPAAAPDVPPEPKIEKIETVVEVEKIEKVEKVEKIEMPVTGTMANSNPVNAPVDGEQRLRALRFSRLVPPGEPHRAPATGGDVVPIPARAGGLTDPPPPPPRPIAYDMSPWSERHRIQRVFSIAVLSAVVIALIGLFLILVGGSLVR